MKTTISPRQVARAIGVGESTLKRWCDRGLIPMLKTAGGHRRLAVSDVNPTLSTLAEDWRDAVVHENPTFRDVRWNRSTEVKVTTMDDLIDEFGAPHFCKIDVEGFEADVLAGLSRPIKALSIEFVAGTLQSTTTCVDRLESLGQYEYNAIRGEGRDFLWSTWRSASEVRAWLAGEASAISSGDLYARHMSTD